MSAQLIPSFPLLAELPFNPLLFFSLLFIRSHTQAHTRTLCTLTSALRNDRHPSASNAGLLCKLISKVKGEKVVWREGPVWEKETGVERVAEGGVEGKKRAVGMRSTQRRGREEFGNIGLESGRKHEIDDRWQEWGPLKLKGKAEGFLETELPLVSTGVHLDRSYKQRPFGGLEHGTDVPSRDWTSKLLRTLGWVKKKPMDIAFELFKALPPHLRREGNSI